MGAVFPNPKGLELTLAHRKARELCKGSHPFFWRFGNKYYSFPVLSNGSQSWEWHLLIPCSVNSEVPQQNPVQREAGSCDSSSSNFWEFPEFIHKAASRSWGRGSTVMAGNGWTVPSFPRVWSARGSWGCPVAVLGCGECV